MSALDQVFDALHTGKELLDRVQGRVDEGFSKIGAIAHGRIIEDVKLIADQAKVVTHGVGTRPSGAIIVRQSAPASAYMVSADGNRLKMLADADVTVSLWVF